MKRASLLAFLFSPLAWANLGGPIHFDRACEPAYQELRIAAVGDVLLHEPLQKQVSGSPDGFLGLWRAVLPFLRGADLTYANLEGPSAPGLGHYGKKLKDPGGRYDGKVYTGYPMFNYPDELPLDLASSGVDVVSTANNHALDRGPLGLELTLKSLDRAGILHTGTRRRGAGVESWVTFTDSGGFRLAWLACTYGTNGIPDRADQVLGCNEDRALILDGIRKLSSLSSLHGVILTPHWGAEYQIKPADSQRELAREWLEAGATAVIGAHPHVLQPWEKVRISSGEEKFVLYSLGNFVSGQKGLLKKTTIGLLLGLSRGRDGKAWVNGARALPLFMRGEADGDPFELVPLDVRASPPSVPAKLVLDLFGSENLLSSPDEPLIPNPRCH